MRRIIGTVQRGGAGGRLWRSVIMVKNVGSTDRIIRLAVAAVLVFLVVTPAVNGWLAYLFLGVAAYLVISALIGFCLIFKSIDFDSCVRGGTYHSGEDPFDGRGGD